MKKNTCKKMPSDNAFPVKEVTGKIDGPTIFPVTFEIPLIRMAANKKTVIRMIPSLVLSGLVMCSLMVPLPSSAEMLLAGGGGGAGGSNDSSASVNTGGTSAMQTGKGGDAQSSAGGGGGGAYSGDKSIDLTYSTAGGDSVDPAGGSGGTSALRQGTGTDGQQGESSGRGDRPAEIGGKGGDGGGVVWDAPNSLMSTEKYVLAGGEGGRGGDSLSTEGTGGAGGNGGSVTFSRGQNVGGNGLSLTGGNGQQGGHGTGNGAIGGAGGNGGDAATVMGQDLSIYGNTVLRGGNGSDGGDGLSGRGSDGGHGGSVTLTVDRDMLTGKVAVTSGNGGTRGYESGATGSAGNGGNGGDANISIGGNLTVDNDIRLTSGSGSQVIRNNPADAADIKGVAQGGNAGNVTFSAASVTADSITLSSGSGGVGSNRDIGLSSDNGKGGSAGDIKLDVTENVGVNVFNVTGNNGGQGGDGDSATSTRGGNGGVSGAFDLKIGQNLNADTVNVHAGNGASGGNNLGGNGGNGSGGQLTVGQNLTGKTLEVVAGDGGNGGSGNNVTSVSTLPGTVAFAPDVMGDGGDGGSFAVNIGKTLDMESLAVTSGNNGTVGNNNVSSGFGGNAGTVTLTAETLITKNATFTRNDGELTAVFKNLDMNANDTVLDLNNTQAYNGLTGVSLGKLAFGENRSLTINGNGAFSVSGLSVTGKNASYTGSSLDLSGKNMSFELSADVGKDDVMLNTSAPVVMNGTTVDVSSKSTVPVLSKGDKIVLVSQTQGTMADNRKMVTLFQDGAVAYDMMIENWNNQLIATRGGRIVLGKAYSEGKLAGLASIVSGADVIAGLGTRLSSNPKTGTDVFFSVQGASEKIKTGSHIKSNGFELIGGVSMNNETSYGTLHTAAFLEGGWGNYSTNNSFSFVDVYGDGDTRYFGAGLLARHDFSNRFYAEGSLRAGKVKSKYSSGDMGPHASFDSDSWYYGAHAGAGYLVGVRDGNNIDVYAKVLWTHQNGDNLNSDANENIHFDSADSLRSRIGARFNQKLDDNFRGYAGLAWDHEFKGSLGAVVDGDVMDKPDMGGSTGVLELGVSWQAKKAWTFDANVQGMLGQREGVAGTVTAKYSF